MIDRKFYKNIGPHKLSKIAEILEIAITPELDFSIKDIKALSDAGPEDLTFLNNKKYAKDFATCRAKACLVPLDFVGRSEFGTISLPVKNPYDSYAKLLDIFYTPAKNTESQIKPSAYISPLAKIGNNCYIGHNVVIEDEVEIGDDCIIESGTIIEYKVKIGNRARIDQNVVISHSIIGNDAVILTGAKIGQDGFGFSTEKGIHKKIYHTGRVIIGNDVEIGANSTIDRGSVNDTIIEDLCRIDNLVQIGHNVHVKKGAILVAQVGIAGSTRIGSYCALGGQVGIAGHLNIADFVQIAGQGGVIQSINEAGIMGGTPAVPIRDWHKQTILMKKLINNKK
jgi:UDP-3-O-[3-hydroxymyristoyl] glucosamine N-acyltransferase